MVTSDDTAVMSNSQVLTQELFDIKIVNIWVSYDFRFWIWSCVTVFSYIEERYHEFYLVPLTVLL